MATKAMAQPLRLTGGWLHHPMMEKSGSMTDGKPIKLDDYELSHSFAIQSDGRRFVLGADWGLRAFDAEGKPLWRYSTTGAVWRRTSPPTVAW